MKTGQAVIAALASITTLATLGMGMTMANTTKASTASKASSSATSSKTVVEVLHSAYLIAGAKSGSRRIKLEPTGSQLTIESGSTPYWWHVKDASGKTGYITKSAHYTERAKPLSVPLPQNITLDPSLTPLAPINSSSQQKFNAILKVAKSKLGTPYVHNHNEDRGQYGFDCSNYVEYVYHHALGYLFSTASRTQYTSVGTRVAVSQMKPGDMLSFDDGGHAGIYIGNGEMIQCGGGLGKVGYLKVSPGSYWYKHLSAVKRMY